MPYFFVFIKTPILKNNLFLIILKNNTMPIDISNTIIIILSTLIFVLIFVVIKLNIQFYNEKKSFKKKMKVLGEIIGQISKDNSVKVNQISISEEFDSKLKAINTRLGSDIFELNTELFQILSTNKLA